jgi:hypothetical protein
MLTSMKKITSVLIGLDPNPTRLEMNRHISQSIIRARKRLPVAAFTGLFIRQGYNPDGVGGD